MKPRRMRWAGHVARVRDDKYAILVGKPERRNKLGDLGVDGRTVLEWYERNRPGCCGSG